MQLGWVAGFAGGCPDGGSKSFAVVRFRPGRSREGACMGWMGLGGRELFSIILLHGNYRIGYFRVIQNTVEEEGASRVYFVPAPISLEHVCHRFVSCRFSMLICIDESITPSNIVGSVEHLIT